MAEYELIYEPRHRPNSGIPSSRAHHQHYIEMTIPSGISYEVFQSAAHPGWESKSEFICKASQWVGMSRGVRRY
jgi:RES domain-containing protein